MKKFAIAMFALLICAVILPNVLAALDVSVQDINVDNGPVYVGIGETIPVKAYFSYDTAANDVVVEAELSYGHGKNVDARTMALDVIPGVIYTKQLSIKIPTDIETTLPGEEYTLTVIVKDGNGNVLDSAEFPVAVQRTNDLLDVQKVIKTTAEAGKTTLVTVIVKNTGSDKQEDIYVKVTIPQLGVAAEQRLGDLVAIDTDDQNDASTVDVPLRIPSNAADGTYSLIVTASNGNVEVSKTDSIKVKGVLAKMDASEVVPQVSSQAIEQGKSVNYGITVSNLAENIQTYSVEVSGTDGWATYDVSPLKVTLDSKDSHVVNVMLTADAKAMIGAHTFVVTVKDANDQVVKQMTITADVKASKAKIDAMLVSVIVLAVVLLILVIILVKSKKAETGTETEESYY